MTRMRADKKRRVSCFSTRLPLTFCGQTRFLLFVLRVTIMSVATKARLSNWSVWSAVAGLITLFNWGFYVLQGQLVPSQPIRFLLRSGVTPSNAVLFCLAPLVALGPLTFALGALARRQLLKARPPESGMDLAAFAVVVGVLTTLASTVWMLCLLELGDTIRGL